MLDLSHPLAEYPDIQAQINHDPSRYVCITANGQYRLARRDADFAVSYLSPPFDHVKWLQTWCGARPVGDLPTLEFTKPPAVRATGPAEISAIRQAIRQGFIPAKRESGWLLSKLVGRATDGGFVYAVLSPTFPQQSWLARWIEQQKDLSALEFCGEYSKPPVDGPDEKSRRINEYLVMHGRTITPGQLDHLLEHGPPDNWDGQ